MGDFEYQSYFLRTCVITVTYGNRLHLLKQVIEAVLGMGVGKLIVVDNGSGDETKIGIAKYIDIHGNCIECIDLLENRGSAGGFRSGLERAAELDYDFIWLLDDDNKPIFNALEALIKNYYYLGNVPTNCLLSRRISYSNNQEKDCYRVVKSLPPNSFLGFHFKDILTKFKNIFSAKPSNDLDETTLDKLDCALYGGFFFHSSWLIAVGYPMSELFVDMDDIEYSERFLNQQAIIYNCSDSVILDIDTSWPNGNMFVSPNANEDRIYYSARNRIFLNKSTNMVIVILNTTIYSIYLIILACVLFRNYRKVFMRLKLIYLAIRHGQRGLLGRRNIVP